MACESTDEVRGTRARGDSGGERRALPEPGTRFARRFRGIPVFGAGGGTGSARVVCHGVRKHGRSPWHHGVFCGFWSSGAVLVTAVRFFGLRLGGALGPPISGFLRGFSVFSWGGEVLVTGFSRFSNFGRSGRFFGRFRGIPDFGAAWVPMAPPVSGQSTGRARGTRRAEGPLGAGGSVFAAQGVAVGWANRGGRWGSRCEEITTRTASMEMLRPPGGRQVGRDDPSRCTLYRRGCLSRPEFAARRFAACVADGSDRDAGSGEGLLDRLRVADQAHRFLASAGGCGRSGKAQGPVSDQCPSPRSAHRDAE